MASPAGLFSITKYAADLKSQGIAVGRELLYEYLAHLEDSFLIGTVPIAADSEKRRQVNPRKIYPVDTAFIPVFDRSLKSNTGHALEVAVYQELLRRGAEVAYWKTRSGYEVDFYARFPDGSQQFIQVTVSIDDRETRERELRALLEAMEECHGTTGIVLTLESRVPWPEVPKTTEVMPAWQWMLLRQ